MGIIAHGIDLVDFPRIEDMVKRHGERFLDRVFTASEQQYANANKNGIEKLAGRFAAKEAVIKAVSKKYPLDLTDIMILNRANGAPYVKFKKRVNVDIFLS